MNSKTKARIDVLSVVGIVLGIIGIIGTTVGIIISIKVSRGQTYGVYNVAVDINNPCEEVKVVADKGDLYWKLANTTGSNTDYKVEYKGKKNQAYSTVFNNKLNSNSQTAWLFSSTSSKTVDRFYRVTQRTNLSPTISYFDLYFKVN